MVKISIETCGNLWTRNGAEGLSTPNHGIIAALPTSNLCICMHIRKKECKANRHDSETGRLQTKRLIVSDKVMLRARLHGDLKADHEYNKTSEPPSAHLFRRLVMPMLHGKDF